MLKQMVQTIKGTWKWLTGNEKSDEVFGSLFFQNTTGLMSCYSVSVLDHTVL